MQALDSMALDRRQEFLDSEVDIAVTKVQIHNVLEKSGDFCIFQENGQHDSSPIARDLS